MHLPPSPILRTRATARARAGNPGTENGKRVPEKSRSVLCQRSSVTDKFEFIDAEYAIYLESDEQYVPSIVKMCIWMEVSRSGFYEWRNAPESETAKSRGILALYIRKSFEMAARNYPLGENAIFHSDRGSNYTSCQFAATLKKHDLRHSAGRTGICYDNAMAESFFAALKNERVYRTQYPTREHAYRDIVRYIEFWYNSKRRHSGLQYRTPRQVHDEYLEQQIAG